MQDCEVQDGVVVEEETDGKNEQFMSFEGLDDDEDGMDVDDEDNDDQGDF